MAAGAFSVVAYLVSCWMAAMLLTSEVATFGAIVLLAPVFVLAGLILAAQSAKHRHELECQEPPWRRQAIPGRTID